MKNKSIIIKLFFITSTVFILFIGIMLMSQTLFFEKFYISQKKNNLKNNIEEFASQYQKEKWNQEETSKKTSQFSDINNAQIAILDENGTIKYLNNYELEVKTTDRGIIKVPINNIMYANEFKDLNLEVGKSIAVEGIFAESGNKMLGVSNIESQGKKWESFKTDSKTINVASVSITSTSDTKPSDKENISIQLSEPVYEVKVKDMKTVVAYENPTSNKTETPNMKVVKLDTQKITGEIISTNVPSKVELISPYQIDMLWSAIDNWFWVSKANNFDLTNQKDIISYDYTSPSNGMSNAIFVKPLKTNNSTKETLFVMASLQPVGEAMTIMKDFYIYAFIAALVLIILLSFIYSKMISKPLISLNTTALKMANLDFTEECKFTSGDEIGSLAKSLNTMSKNLKSNMDELRSANEQLMEDIEKERRLESIRKEFVSSVSHELKTPLSLIKGFTEGLKDGVADDKREYYIDVILDEAHKMDELVLDMLDLSKLESKAYKLKWENFCINSLILESSARFENQLEKKKAEIIYLSHEDSAVVHADKKRIDQVVSNLLSNAVRHVNVGGTIKISSIRNDDSLSICIENSGKHIPEEKLERIWDRFYRVEESRDRQSGGTGLGLSIVKNILELHNSSYGAYNTESGVTFYFDLKVL